MIHSVSFVFEALLASNHSGRTKENGRLDVVLCLMPLTLGKAIVGHISDSFSSRGNHSSTLNYS